MLGNVGVLLYIGSSITLYSKDVVLNQNLKKLAVTSLFQADRITCVKTLTYTLAYLGMRIDSFDWKIL